MKTNFHAKLLSLVLCLAMLCTMLPIGVLTAFAEEVAPPVQDEIIVPEEGEEEEDELDVYAEAVDVKDGNELAAALLQEAKAIRIVADFELNQTFFVTNDTVIYSEQAHTLTRAPGFAGDIFVVGQYEDGTVCDTTITLSVGHTESETEDLLIIDGNRDNMTVSVNGTIFFGCSNSKIRLYHNLTVKNCQKVGNERTLDEGFSLSYPDRIGGAVAIVAGGTMNIYGGNYLGNRVNDENKDAENTLISTQGGAFYFYGNANIYGGTFSGNHAQRGGAFYVYRTLNIRGGVIKENTASDKGGAVYMPASTLAYLYISGDADESTPVYFKDNHAVVHGGALYCQGVLVDIDTAVFEGNATDGYGGAIYCLIDGDEKSDVKLNVTNTTFKGNSVVYSGGAVYISGSHGYFENVVFDGNHADAVENSSGNPYGGGAIYSTGSYVEINGAEIKNNSSDNHGGALEAHSSSKLVLNEITTSNNTAGLSGGFLYVNKSEIQIYNSAIRENTANSHGGAGYFTNSATLHAYVTTFENNTAGSQGGALYIYTDAVTSLLHSCVFLENKATSYGGAIYVSKASILEAYNTSAKGNSGEKGGFMYETTTGTTVTLNGLIVSGNTSVSGGPIIWGNTVNSTLYINKSNYIDVDVSTALDDAYWKSAIANKLTVFETEAEIPGFVNYGDSDETPPESIINPNITNVIELQTALAAGLREITIISDFIIDRPCHIIDDITIRINGERTLKRNPAFGGDMFIIGQNIDGTLCENEVNVSFEPLTDSSLTIDGNSENMTVDVVGTIFFVCSTGHLELYDGITVTNCKKVGNDRTNDEIHELSNAYPNEIGGAVAIIARGTLDIYGGTYSNNIVNDAVDGDETSSRGGVIYAFGNVNIYGGTFSNNHAHRAGAIYVYRKANIYNATFDNNTAHIGGVIYIPASTVAYLYIGGATSKVESNVKFTNNSATSTGGAIYASGEFVQIENAEFVGNSSTSHGGAIYISSKSDSLDDAKMIIKDSAFEQNTTNANGGAVYLTGSCVHFSNVDFKNNRTYATSYGGGAVYSTGGITKFEGVRFVGNISDCNGGGIALYSASESILYNVTADNNTSASGAGFLYNSKSKADIYNSKFINNTANGNGGAVHLAEGASANIYSTKFHNNTASGDGGALYVYTNATTSVLNNVEFINNTSSKNGGAVYVSKASLLYIYNAIVKNNSADKGGFLYETTTGTEVTLNGVTVEGNTAASGGPIIWGNTTNAKLFVNKNNFVDLENSATNTSAYWSSAVANKLTVKEITDAIPDCEEYGNENYENLAGYVSVSNVAELEKALNDKVSKIRIISDFEIDRTLYVISDVTIFSTTPYRLTRASNFAGDLFVIGEKADGTSLLLTNEIPKVSFGNPDSTTKDLLVIDGNRKGMTVDVVGTVLFICHSAEVNVYSNLSIVNAKKVGNERTYSDRYTLSYPNRIGGAAIIHESGALNIKGASFRGNIINNEVISEELGEDGRISTLGGAIFSMGDINLFDGDFQYNKAARGGVIYNYRMMHVYSGNFSNNFATSGGGVFYLPSSEYACVYIGSADGDSKIIFKDNGATKSGGAIYSSALAATIIYGNTEFDGNIAQNSNGGAIYASGTLLANNVTFKNNDAYSKGGAVFLSNTSNERVVRLNEFNNCTFTNNIANKGGAVSNYASSSSFNEGSKATFNNCTFTGNEGVTRVGTNSTSAGYGGAFYALYRSIVNVNGCTFKNNRADYEGGVIYLGYETNLNVDSSTFTENSAGTENNGYGGAISVHSSIVNITNSEFSQNAAILRGGALYISYNSARKTDSEVTISNSTFNQNTSELHGGAIYSTDRMISYGVDSEGVDLPKEDNNTLNIKLFNVEFDGNIAQEKGGAIYLTNYSHAFMQNVKFSKNEAVGEISGHNAGAIYSTGKSTFEINGGEFTENKAGANGGAIGLYSSSSAVMNNITATGNSAVSSAGFMICDTAYVTIYNSTINGNTAGTTAGAISTVDLATVHIYGTTFDGNTSVKDGGALYIYAGAIESVIQDCTFRNNISSANGGAIYASKSSILKGYNLVAEQNSANKGGFLYETTASTAVTLNGLTVEGNTATTGGPIIWGNTTTATLYINKSNYTDRYIDVLDDAYWQNAIYNALKVKDETGEIPAAATYTQSYVPETENKPTVHNEVDVDHIFYLADNAKDLTISSSYSALLKLDSTSNFMSKNTKVFNNINGKDVTVDSFVYQKNDVEDNCTVGEGLLIYQAICYKREHPEEDVSISLSAFRISVAAAICIDRNSRYFGYMRALYGVNYDSCGFVRISYLLTCAASMGINVTVIGQLDGNPKSAVDPGFDAYFTDWLDAPCDSDYQPGKLIGDYLTFSSSKWTSYDNKAATDMMHTKLCAVSHYLDINGVEHQNAVWLSSTNLDGINSSGTNGVNKLQTAVLISDHSEIYNVSRNYLNLLVPFNGQEDAYEFRDIAIKRSTEQIKLLLEGKGNEIPSDEQIVYLGSENDDVFELYFAPFGGDLSTWNEDYNPFTKQLRALQNSEDSIIFIWNNVKFVKFSLRNQMQDVIIDAFVKNPNPDNKLYINLPEFDETELSKLTVGEDIGYISINKFEYGDIHNKDIQLSYVQNGKRYYVSLLNSMNIHAGSMAYQSNFALVLKETDCDEGSVFFSLADETTSGIVSHDFTDEVHTYLPDTNEDGYTYHACSNCDLKEILGVVHRAGDWVVVKEATKDQNGVSYKRCTACDLLLETREFEYAGDDLILNAQNTYGKTFTNKIEDQNIVQLDSTPKTIEVTIQLDRTQLERGGVILGNYDNSDKNQFNLEVYTQGKLRLFSIRNGIRSICYFSTDIRSSKPVHIAVTIEGKVAKLYINGQLKETANMATTIPDLSGEFLVGGDYRTTNQQYFKGTIYSVALFSDIRTDDEIKEDSVAIFDDAQDLMLLKRYEVDKMDAELTTEAGKTFHEDDYVDIGTLSAKPLTIEATINVPKTQSQRVGTIIGNYDGALAERFNLEIYNYGIVRLYVHNGTVSKTYSFNKDIRSDDPVHIAVTFDGLVATLYVNGERSSAVTMSYELPDIKEGLRIGGDKRKGNDQYFKGTIYNVNMFSSVRTQEQIKSDIVSVSPDDENLVFTRQFVYEDVNSKKTGLTYTNQTGQKVGTLSATPHTIEALVKIDQNVLGRGGVIVGNYDTLFHELMNLEIYTEGRVRLFYSDAIGTRADCTFDTDIRSNRAIHITVTIDGLTASLYLNGVLTEQKALPFELPETTTNYRIGGDLRPENTQYFKGEIYSVNLFSDVRSEQEIANDMLGVDSSADALLYTLDVGSDVLETPHYDSVAVGKTFNETNRIKLDTLSATPHTFEAVVQLDENFEGRGGVIIGNYDSFFYELINLEIYTGGRVRLYCSSATGERSDCTFDTDIRSKNAVHIAVTIEGATASLYINGTFREQKSLKFELPETTTFYRIGGDRRNGNAQYFKGTIYSVNLYSDVRTAQEIKKDVLVSGLDDSIYSVMFGVNECDYYGHTEGNWKTDVSMSDNNNAISHVECIECGKKLTYKKQPKVSSVVQNLVFEGAEGFVSDQEIGGYLIEDTFSSGIKTFEAVIQLDKLYTQRAGVIMGNYDGGTGDQINLEVYTLGKFRLYYRINNVAYTYTFNTDVRSDTPTHIALTVEGLTAKLYIDGILKETVTLAVEIPQSISNLKIGGDNRVGNLQYFKGKVYTVSLFSDIRTAQEIAIDRYLITSNSDELLVFKSFLEKE